MIIVLTDVFQAAELERIQPLLAAAELIDGKQTAGWNARDIKNNQQVKAHSPEATQLQELARTALLRHPLFQVAVRPKAIHTILSSHYTIGMSYGTHTDNAIMGGTWRSDVSFTIFLTPPETYQGGDLVIEQSDRENFYKLEANSAIVYPASTLHRVDPITAGERWAIVGWVESWVRDPAKREILFELDTARRSIFNTQGKTDEFDLISKSVSNLLRMWAD